MTLEADNEPGLEWQRAEIEAAFRELWVPSPGSELQLLTERDYAEALRFIEQPGKTWLAPVAIQAVRDGARLHIPGGNREASTRLIEQIRAGALRQGMYTTRASTVLGSPGLHGGLPVASQSLSISAPGLRPLSLRGGSHLEVPSRAC